MNDNNRYISELELCIEYTLTVLLEQYFDNIDELKSYISYEKPSLNENDSKKVYIIPSRFFIEDLYLHTSSLPILPLKQYADIPVLFGDGEITFEDSRVICYIDIIASSYFLLTRYEELVNPKRDKYKRFLAKHSVLYKEGIFTRPIVNEYAELLKDCIEKLDLPVKYNNRLFSITTSHDIDFFNYYWRKYEPFNTGFDFLKGNTSLKRVVESISVKFFNGRDPYHTFQFLLENNQKFKTKTIFYFMVKSQHSLDGENYISDPEFLKFLDILMSNEIEIGLHLSYNSPVDSPLIQIEKNKLEEISGKTIKYCRYHYLRWLNIDQGRELSRAGLTEDSTLGFADYSGFRIGISTPVKLFNPQHFDYLGITEHPLHLMDGSMLLNPYMELSINNALIHSKNIINQVKKYNGELVLLWHNSIFDQYKNIEGLENLYKNILSHSAIYIGNNNIEEK